MSSRRGARGGESLLAPAIDESRFLGVPDLKLKFWKNWNRGVCLVRPGAGEAARGPPAAGNRAMGIRQFEGGPMGITSRWPHEATTLPSAARNPGRAISGGNGWAGECGRGNG